MTVSFFPMQSTYIVYINIYIYILKKMYTCVLHVFQILCLLQEMVRVIFSYCHYSEDCFDKALIGIWSFLIPGFVVRECSIGINCLWKRLVSIDVFCMYKTCAIYIYIYYVYIFFIYLFVCIYTCFYA